MKKFVCPIPLVWGKIYEELLTHWIASGKNGEKPPTPLILNGWVFSNDLAKKYRWLSTIQWAEQHGCTHLIPQNFSQEDSYMQEYLSDYQIGPMGRPMYLTWDFKSKPLLTPQEKNIIFDRILTIWKANNHTKIFQITKPIKLTGKKSRALICEALMNQEAPWGTWHSIKKDKSSKAIFREFRQLINDDLYKYDHTIDHIIFQN